ncbi:MAG TPA: UDP-N-acetylglucosamine 2-epimerase (non-hydrolyzing) [Thermoanaerobaculia bacterium]|nr:UDP-N-acetylglucosamine 2-epimerase (non-hydrolyzing) [Thermoanaerobaculia bacterium]
MKTLACVVGARPNFVKMAPVLAGLREMAPDIRPVLVHTGQHYDEAMSDRFFAQLGLPEPDVHLEVGSGPHGQQTARVLERYEAWLMSSMSSDARPDATLVVGDVNSTLACALASVKLGIPVIHVEAGLRSLDRAMPEEINRVLTDAISDLLLVSEPSGVENLRREGRPESAIRLVGNVMIDVLALQLPEARALGQPEKLGLQRGEYAVWTLHRPSNVDEPEALRSAVERLQLTARRLPVVFPVHPRTERKLRESGLETRLSDDPRVILTEPLGYLEFLGLSSEARLIVTDSGGLQEESTALGIPCLTLRSTTERPITIEEGTSTLVDGNWTLFDTLIGDILEGRYKQGSCPRLWDGRAGRRVAREVAEFLALTPGPPLPGVRACGRERGRG